MHKNGDSEDSKGYLGLFLDPYEYVYGKDPIEICCTMRVCEKYESRSFTYKWTPYAASRGYNKFVSNYDLPGTITIEFTLELKGDLIPCFQAHAHKIKELKSQLTTEKNTISDLRKEMKTLKDDKIASLEKKLDDADEYIPNPIVLPKEDGDSDQKEQALDPIAEHSDLYNRHIAIVAEWDKDTEQLKTLKLDRSELMKETEAKKAVKEGDEKEDDEKENDGKGDDKAGDGNGDDEKVDEMSSDKVIEEFFKQQQMVSRQLERIDKVPTDEHLGELRNHQNALYVCLYNLFCINHMYTISIEAITVNDSVFTLNIGIFKRMGCDMRCG